MRILLVNDHGTRVGGAEVIVFSLRDALRARGHEVRVFSSSAREHGDPIEADATGFGTTSRWRTLVQSVNPRAARSFRDELARFRPDVVHVHLYQTQLSPLILGELGGGLDGVPAVYYAQWYREICFLGSRRRPEGWTCESRVGVACLRAKCVKTHDWPALMVQLGIDRSLGRRFSSVTAISQAVANRLAKHGPPHLRDARVVYPGTEVVEPRRELPSDPVVLVAGRVVEEKGIETLIRAFAKIARRHPTSRLVVVGDGPQRPWLERLAADEFRLADRIEFRGRRTHAETLAAMRQASVVCVPSTWEEPFGMVAAEAQMHGVAVIASRTGGLAEIVEEGVTGHLVPPADFEALAARLDDRFADRDGTMAMGLRGHERARELFSLDGFAERFEAVYRDAITAAAR